MPTGRGWLCALLGLGSIAIGRFLGLVEMYVIGAILLALIVLAVLVAVFRPLRLGVGRTISPPRLHVGQEGRVEVAVRNGNTTTPVMRMTDRVQGTSGARLFLSPLEPDGVARAAYRLPTERRGIVTVGPVEFESTDAFGLSLRRFMAPSVGQLVVYPEVIPLPPAPPSPASERRSTSDVPEFLGGRSEEFHALRPYVPGDDIRRINWAASARHDDLIVREDEAPTLNHLTVMLDNASLTDDVALDRAASVAASILTSMRGGTDPFRLITADGRDTDYVLGPAGLDRTLSILAVVGHTEERGSDPAVPGAQGALVLVTGERPSIDRTGLSAYGRVMTVTLMPSVWKTDGTTRRLPSTAEAREGEVRLRLSSIDDLSSMWSRALSTLLSAGVAR
ncbi:MAG: DUF58 domain-containing protein [Acidimicrobiales bacterium]